MSLLGWEQSCARRWDPCWSLWGQICLRCLSHPLREKGRKSSRPSVWSHLHSLLWPGGIFIRFQNTMQFLKTQATCIRLLVLPCLLPKLSKLLQVPQPGSRADGIQSGLPWPPAQLGWACVCMRVCVRVHVCVRVRACMFSHSVIVRFLTENPKDFFGQPNTQSFASVCGRPCWTVWESRE